MTTHIFNAQNQCIGTGRNLDIMLRRANGRGVSRITVDRLPDSGHWEALVNVFYGDGSRACTNFASFSHACEWANDRSKASPRQSWFVGCLVTINGDAQ
jgi:hypothetical protein